MSEYPEHDKLAAVKDESQAIGEFLDFAGYTLCTHREEGDNGEPRYVWRRPGRTREPNRIDYIEGRAEDNPAYESWRAGLEPTHKSIQTILAEWFEIDQDALEREKRAMLDAIRSAA